MPLEKIIAIAALLFLAGAIIRLYRKGQRDAELIFESDYYNLRQFIKECPETEENELKIHLRLLELSCQKGANKEKLQVLNSEFRRKFVASLGDIVADHENC